MDANNFKAAVKCHRILRQCISFDHIEDGAYIRKNIQKIKKMQSMFPPKMYAKIDTYIRKNIYPIIFNKHYFDFTKRPDIGFINEDGIFEIRSEEGLDKAIALMYEHTFMLGDMLDEFFLKKIYGDIAK